MNLKESKEDMGGREGQKGKREKLFRKKHTKTSIKYIDLTLSFFFLNYTVVYMDGVYMSNVGE